MQINILNDFINAYEKAYKQSFDESFEGRIKALCQSLNEPFMHLSSALKKELKELVFSLERNIQVAIIGQFSSGKSSLLNLILKKEVLPTGAVPVTFKPTFLHFAKEYFLRVEFEDGSDEITDISKLELYTDQRKGLKEAKSLHLYAPISLLENIILVDTPGLNANEIDTQTTFEELKNTHAAIWLSLIDNAGKKSEEDAIKANLRLLGSSSICVLNQKDKLNEAELENVLNYAKSVFSKYFKEVIAISCKQAQSEKSYEHSNFNALLNFLKSLDTKALKQDFTQRKLLEICEILEQENALFESVFDELEAKFKAYEQYLEEFSLQMLARVKILNHQILDLLKGISERISTEIFTFVKEKEAFYYKEAKGFLKKDLYARFEYKTPFISSDDAFLAMFYHTDVMNKEFKKIKFELESSFKDLKQGLNTSFESLQNEILLFKARFSNIQKDDILQSEANFGELRAFCNASEEHFLKDFENALFKNTLELDLFLEKLNLKAFANYENATKLTLSFFSRKINESRTFYELDSTEFSLFYPKKSEIYERVLTELNVYEFEALLVDKPVISRIIKQYFESITKLIKEKRGLILDQKKELKRRLELILKVKENLNTL
ncbi:ATP-binding protein [Campylobacter sp. MIT 99-7217]|uniref:dynamin family protein n=1 Tax=Campylobacter sp. MIT 99-7217 TaxID=535091 RepID=UPI0011581B7D|nr:dynamin family protein [Campylobacter sp. MIT 99-7217]TQR32403.1 ATP-binding protein [Campylobacter sp. MIT 99-7217]